MIALDSPIPKSLRDRSYLMEVVDWGTLEELILVSAVHRHGTCQWDSVVSELRDRMFAPERFTKEVCKEKYEDLQKNYSTCGDLLEGLKMKRKQDLNRIIEKYNGSIGYLERKLRAFTAEKEHSSSVDYQSNPFESPASPCVGKSSGKENSKDGLSAGSITQETIKIQSPPIHAEMAHPFRWPSASSKQDSLPITEGLVTSIPTDWGTGFKKKRGKRKRRRCSRNVKKDNFDELALDAANGNLLLSSCIKVEPTSECDLASPPPVVDEISQGCDALECNELTRIFDKIASNEYASFFRRRLDSQKRARYKMMVRQHMDLDTIKCRIDKQTITSTKELLRDLLLLATNAAIFYSRNTREYMYAVILQGVVKEVIRECKHSSIPSQTPQEVASTSASDNVPCILPANNTPKKPKNDNADSHKSLEKLKNDESIKEDVRGVKKTRKLKDSRQTKFFRQARKGNRQAHNANHVTRQPPQTSCLQ